ncbi:FCD domain-containing protein [Paracoccus limosus]|uniref:FCD domain-containing protein n=1 Tax=Paracoccus limosus TaxID=913252 RepID=A0A844H7S4_9RHOB|nr:FCD domain-containing protein [Paracoccus limosus]
MFNVSRPHRQYRLVADQILGLIASRNLQPGDRLPSERDLAEQMSVSRPSLREALIALEVEGRVEIRMGSGVYVAAGGAEAARLEPGDEVDGPVELLQARCLLESAIAEEAARHVTPEFIARLDACLLRMSDAVHDRALAIQLDGSFHVEIAQATGNSVLASFVATTFERRLTPIFARFSTHFEGPRTWRLAIAEHGAIRDAIAEADPAGAHEAMRHHLTQSQRRFTESLLAEPG